MKFKAKILQFGNNTGIQIPEQILEKLGGGKKPLVIITLNYYTYRSAVGKMGDKFLVSLSAQNRQNANVKGGEEHEINLELDTAPRTVDLPAELKKALDKNKPAKTAFEKLSPSRKKAIVMNINDAKTEETRLRRIEKAITALT